MKVKVNLFLLGTLVASTFVLPPGVLRLNFIELSDFIIIIFSVLVFFDLLRKKDLKLEAFTKEFNLFWSLLIVFMIFSILLYGIHPFTLRIIFYCLLFILFSKFSTRFDLIELSYFIFPFIFLTLLNFSTVLFEISLIENSTGWISYNYENPTFFNRGRLSGYQGSGPNVAGGLFSILTFINLHFYKNLRKSIFLLAALLNASLVFFTFSRGSYLSLAIGVLIVIYSNFGITKKSVFYFFIIFFTGLGFIYFIDSKTLLKESDRGLLTSIAQENINLISKIGPGGYIENIYKDYLLSINPEILEKNLNINLNKVELGITPENYRNSDYKFFIGTSGGGFEILTQSNLVSECSEDRITCQHVRVKKSLLINFLSTVFNTEPTIIEDIINTSSCNISKDSNVNRGEFFCLVNQIQELDPGILRFNSIPTELFYVECEDTKTLLCEERELAVGELAVIVEKLSINSNIVPLDNFADKCNECKFRNALGYIKLEFDKHDNILPRSKFSIYTSDDEISWKSVGYSRTTGEIINFNINESYIEIGGHTDGQSFGNTFLDATIYEFTYKNKQYTKKIMFNENNLNKEYYVFKPNTLDPYTANITFDSGGIKLFRPNKYWLAIDNEFDFQNDFEIILKLSIPEIPWERQTLLSNTSGFSGQTQSWKFEIDDGRPFFYWANPEGVYVLDNKIGDKSLRSGVFVQKDGKITNSKPPIIDPSFLSQLTTAHNGYLTFSVEYGLIISLGFYFLMLSYFYKMYRNLSDINIYIFVSTVMIFIQNLTNDMIYSPDIFVIFIISNGLLYQSSKSSAFKKS